MWVCRLNVEFIVKPREALFLEGSMRRLPRVQKDEAYPCQMHKQQSFSCLFRHYAKHNGLKKEDLVFYFVDELKPDETPESVHLMCQDEIWVEHRKHDIEEDPEDRPFETGAIYEQFYTLLPGGEFAGDHADVVFKITECGKDVHAHRALLSVRSEYFRAMFKRGGMIESKEAVIQIKDHSYETFNRMVEFVYTNNIRDIEDVSSEGIMELLTLADEYILSDLRVFCEHHAAKCLTFQNIGKFYVLSQEHNAEDLRSSCQRFVANNCSALKGTQDFRNEIECNPQLGLLLFDALQSEADLNEHAHSNKTRKTSKTVQGNGKFEELEIAVVSSNSNEINQ